MDGFILEVKKNMKEFVTLSQQLGYSAKDAELCIQQRILETTLDTLVQRQDQWNAMNQEARDIQDLLIKEWTCLGIHGDSDQTFSAMKGLPLFERCHRLKELLQRTKEQKKQRKEDISALWKEYDQLARKLGHAPIDFGSKRQLTDEAVAAVQAGIARLKAETKELVVQMKEQCKAIAEQFRLLELKPDRNIPLHLIVFSEYSDANHCDQLISYKDDILHLNEQVKTVRKQRKAQALVYAQEIVVLWDILSVPSAHQENFFEVNRGLGESVVESCSRELSGLRERRATQLDSQKNAALKDIERLWSIAFKSKSNAYPKSRKKELLEKLEQLLNPSLIPAVLCGANPIEQNRLSLADRILRLESAVRLLDAELTVVIQELSKPIASLIEKRKGLLTQKEQLSALEKDPARLSSRKGNLIQETALRTQVAKLKPLEKEIIKKCQEFVESIGQPFLYQGENYIEVIERDKEADRPATRERDRVSVAARSVPSTVAQPATSSSRTTRANTSTSVSSTPRTPGVRKALTKPALRSAALY